MLENHETKRGIYSIIYVKVKLEKAVDAIRSGLMSLRKAENSFNIPRSTLQNHASEKFDCDAKIGRKTALPDSVENKLAETVKQASKQGLVLPGDRCYGGQGNCVNGCE
jgi:hypothetical protein